MSEYETDFVAWANEQGQALRARSMNALDWDNLAEEIEALGRSETDAVVSLLTLAVGHKLRLLARPDDNAAAHWKGEIRTWLSRVAKKHRASMHIDVQKDVYVDAVVDTLAYMPGVSLPSECPWTLAELLAEGEAIRVSAVKR
jgi:hypothetical protein